MSREDEKRKKYWEDDEDEETSLNLAKGGNVVNRGSPQDSKKTEDEVNRKIQEAKVMLEQTHQLYQNYFNKVEKRAPIEKLRFLEAKINELKVLSTAMTSERFKINQVVSLYQTYRDLWERKLKEKERVG